MAILVADRVDSYMKHPPEIFKNPLLVPAIAYASAMTMFMTIAIVAVIIAFVVAMVVAAASGAAIQHFFLVSSLASRLLQRRRYFHIFQKKTVPMKKKKQFGFNLN